MDGDILSSPYDGPQPVQLNCGKGAHRRGKNSSTQGPRSLPLAAASCEQAFSVDAIYFLDDQRAWLADLARVLVASGRLCLTFAGPDFMTKLTFTKHGFRLVTADEVEALAAAGFGTYHLYQHWQLASQAEPPAAVARWSMPAGTQVQLFGGDRLLISPPGDDHIIVDARTLDELHRVSADFSRPLPGPSPDTFLILDGNVLSSHSFAAGEVVAQTDPLTDVTDENWKNIRACPGLVDIYWEHKNELRVFDGATLAPAELTEQQKSNAWDCAWDGARLREADEIALNTLAWPLFGRMSGLGLLLPDGTAVDWSIEGEAKQKAGFHGVARYAARSASGWTTVYWDVDAFEDQSWLLGWDAQGAPTGFTALLEGDARELSGDRLLLSGREFWRVVNVHTGEQLHEYKLEDRFDDAGLDAEGNLCIVPREETREGEFLSDQLFVCTDISTSETSRVIEIPQGSRLVRIHGQFRLGWVLETSEGVFIFN